MSVTVKWHPEKFLSDLNYETEIAIEEIGEEISYRAEQLVPVKTGKLQESIKHEENMQTDYKESIISANTEYAVYVELGTIKQSPQPFMRNSLTDSLGAIRDILRNAVKRACKG